MERSRSSWSRFDAEVSVTEESGNMIASRLKCQIWSSEEFSSDCDKELQQFNKEWSKGSAPTNYEGKFMQI